ncbi:MAG: hypothetical protein ABSD42_14095 [Candidatus Bathyarchaeia archaeon]
MDIESTHYDATKGELITAGFLSKNGFTILQRVQSSEAEFKAYMVNEMKELDRPFYAFNKSCEEGFCGSTIDRDLQIGQEATYIALRNEGLLDHYNLLCDPLFNEEIPEYWNTWIITKNPLFLSKIVRHNYCCLAKEYYLKLKRVDKIEPNKIKPFISSAAIEKKCIWPPLNVSLL